MFSLFRVCREAEPSASRWTQCWASVQVQQSPGLRQSPWLSHAAAHAHPRMESLAFQLLWLHEDDDFPVCRAPRLDMISYHKIRMQQNGSISCSGTASPSSWICQKKERERRTRHPEFQKLSDGSVCTTKLPPAFWNVQTVQCYSPSWIPTQKHDGHWIFVSLILIKL